MNALNHLVHHGHGGNAWKLWVSIPRQSRGLWFVSRSKRLAGVANAAPNVWSHLSVAG